MGTMFLHCMFCSAENPPDAVICSTCGATLTGDPSGFSTALPAGAQLKGDTYVVGKVLGHGGFGITYVGDHVRMRRTVAIKEFFPSGAMRQGAAVYPATLHGMIEYAAMRERFSEEARMLARFSHPGIVDVFDSFEENNTAYMVMEYLRGRTLGELLEKRDDALPEQEALDYIRRAGEALDVVHDAGVLHRDLKPDNIMVTDDGRVVLIDFGTARAFAVGVTHRMTRMVTPGYAPLEQYGEQARFGRFSDVYGLGATLYHLLTGEMPTPATDRAGGIPLKAPRQLNARVSPKVSETVMWALEMRVDRRPQTLRAFLDVLRAATATKDRWVVPAITRWAILKFALLGLAFFLGAAAVLWSQNCELYVDLRQVELVIECY